MKKLILPVVISSLLVSGSALALEQDELKKLLEKRLPQVKVLSMEKAQMDGFYFVDFDQGGVIVSDDGKYLINGDLINIVTKNNLTEKHKAKKNVLLLNAVADKDMIIFKAKNETDFIYIFTDPTCPYCRLMHKEIEALNNNGITVKYLLYPRGHEQGPGYEQIQAILHATDRNEAVATIKQQESMDGYEFSAKTEAQKQAVKNEISRAYELGNAVGVSGTPAIFLSNGLGVPGYKAADELTSIVRDERQ